MSFAGKRFDFHEYFDSTVADIFGVNLRNRSRYGRSRRSDLPNKLFGGFIHAHDGKSWIIGPLVNVQNIFHIRHKLRVMIRWYLPTFAQVRLENVFFRMVPTDDFEIDSV